MSIRYKLLLACMLSGIVPTLILGGIGWNAASNMEEQTAQEFATLAKNVGEKIDRNLFERYGDVQAFGLNHAVRKQDSWYIEGEDNPIVLAMNDYVDTYDIYYLTLLVDLEGKLIAVNTRDANGESVDTQALYKNDYSNESWFRDAIAGNFYESEDGSFSGTVVEHLYVDPLVEEIYKDEGLALGYTAPVKDADGKVIAVWKNVTDFALVEEICQSSYQDLKARGLTGAEITLLDEAGNVIVDYDPTKRGTEDVVRDMEVISKFNLCDVGVSAAQEVVAGKSGSIVSVTHARKQINQSAGYAPLRGALGFPGMKWNVLVRVPVEQAHAGATSLKNMMLFGALFIFAGITAVSIFMATRLTRPINVAVDTLTSMAQGDLTQRMNDSSKDEFGQMATSFNEFANQINSMVRDLTRNADSLNHSSSELSTVSQNLSDGANDATSQSSTVAAAAEEMSVNLSNMAKNTEDVSSNVNSAAKSVEEITLSIGEVAQNAERSASVANDAANLVQVSNRKVEDLGEAADEIGKVIEVIQDIAEQTNLLALNATIEAARAGEAGKGFAVVATEVKELAKQTGAATDDIRRRIEGIQSSTGDAVSAIREISEVISNVNEVSKTIAAAVEEQRSTTTQIADTVKQTAVAAESVAKSVSESATAGQEITQNISQVDQILRRTAAGAEQSRSAGENFKTLSQEMRGMVDRFQTGSTNQDSVAV